ncbi:hypothetical protein CBE01nite_44930 [Clostridium beijerinckii]|uniref:Type 4 fimbrial biogenesis protein PilX N-terminal domain-containing protein n=1 Tax=Clostridium beijerinckii TaxID=1520 RepID=A0AB74VD48_CLOBE|nr:hypothetical protein [Clostridium beijerinckii]NRZ28719.1 hypothetical protein [Clostridium beijerinckii]NYB95505.1 hypothetical protein [Clostridium beijerinckii]OOM20444.1 hypothetical protein CLBEI_44110 [Clostridium beijerinckii]QUN34398.1 hypothetical protein KEC93_21110 [Clostridium beijerinckii]SQB00648.1 Uncharacterised protein [Clostridium beijerinckii]
MKRKKEGATLIVSVIIFAFVITVMTASLSMVAGEYKIRVVESQRVENLYSAESGLDVAYNIIGRTFNAAVEYGNTQVTNLMSGVQNDNSTNDEKYAKLKEDINYWKDLEVPDDLTSDAKRELREEKRTNIIEDNDNIELLKNEEFKRAFNEFLYRSGNNLEDTKDINNADELAKSILGKKYVKNINKDSEDDRYEHVVFNNNDGQEEPGLFVYDDKNPTPDVDVEKDKSGISYNEGEKNELKSISRTLDGIEENNDLNIDVYDKQEYIIKVTSNFETTNLRQVQAVYTIKVPDYMQSIKKYAVLDNKSLVVGKNMNLINVNNIEVNGQIFVQGDASEVTGTGEIAYDKYLGGIKIDKSKGITFDDNVITRSTFNIIDQVSVNIKGSLYARNVYVGKGKDFASGLAVDKSKLDILNDLVVDNDLTLKAHNTDITINNFYGINDITDNDSDDTKKRNSSSIIVNKDKSDDSNPFTSSINITNEAWIMGAAYINTDGKYETGESIGIKGNYEAYSSSVGSDASKNLHFEYDNPLYLINGTVIEKGEHFVDYWDALDNINNLDVGEIKLSADLSKIHSIGAIVFKDKDGNKQLKGPTYHMDNETAIGAKQIEYAEKVYKLGETATEDDYRDGEDGAINVSELIDLSNIEDLDYNLEDEENKSEKAIFNNEDRIIIIENTTGEDSIEVPDDSSSPIVIKAKNGVLNGVIVTNGDVEIQGGITFRGSIITNGTLDITGNDTKLFKDDNVVKNVQAQNLDIFEEVFKNGHYYNTDADYDLSKYLDEKLWKLIK